MKAVSSQTNLFDEEIERDISKIVEGPFGDLLNNKILKAQDQLHITRKENLLIRKFFAVNELRKPLKKRPYEEALEEIGNKNNPYIILDKMLHETEFAKKYVNHKIHSPKVYIEHIKKMLYADSVEDLAKDLESEKEVFDSVRNISRKFFAPCCAIWDCSDTGLEFIFTENVPTYEDVRGILSKEMYLNNYIEKIKDFAPSFIIEDLLRIIVGTASVRHNYYVQVISPTRAIVYYSPYFKAFFNRPVIDLETNTPILDIGPYFSEDVFNESFYYKYRMELFEPCQSIVNKSYIYKIHKLTRKETLFINACHLNFENKNFIFHDYNKIVESFYYYDNQIEFLDGTNYNFKKLNLY